MHLYLQNVEKCATELSPVACGSLIHPLFATFLIVACSFVLDLISCFMLIIAKSTKPRANIAR